MNKLNSISNTLAGRAAMLAGAALAAGGITQIVHSQRHSGNKGVGVAGYLSLSFFVVALIAIAPSFIAMGRYARPGVAQKGAVAAAAGTAVLGLTSITSLVYGHDLGLFNVVAPLTNAAWLFGSIILAVSLKRAGKVSGWVAIGLPVAWVATIPLATVGGGVIAGAYFLAVGYLLADDAIQGAGRPIAQTAGA
jgi:hypothetical protein